MAGATSPPPCPSAQPASCWTVHSALRAPPPLASRSSGPIPATTQEQVRQGNATPKAAGTTKPCRAVLSGINSRTHRVPLSAVYFKKTTPQSSHFLCPPFSLTGEVSKQPGVLSLQTDTAAEGSRSAGTHKLICVPGSGKGQVTTEQAPSTARAGDSTESLRHSVVNRFIADSSQPEHQTNGTQPQPASRQRGCRRGRAARASGRRGPAGRRRPGPHLESWSLSSPRRAERTPSFFSSSTRSPFWCICRRMSQPPTNSPLRYTCGMVGQLE